MADQQGIAVQELDRMGTTVESVDTTPKADAVGDMPMEEPAVVPQLNKTEVERSTVPVQESPVVSGPRKRAQVDARGLTLLALFGGEFREGDGLETYCEELGAKVVVIDRERGPEHDLCDQGVWDKILEDLEAEVYDGVSSAAPCATFSGARKYDGGPRPLRGESPPEIFGFPWLTPKELEEVKVGTLLAHRGAEACRKAYDQGKPFWFETPAAQDGKPSVFKLPRLISLDELEGVETDRIWQCRYCARTAKPTDFKNYGVRLSKRGQACNHEKRWWRRPWDGKWHYGAHPLLEGTQWMIPAEDFHWTMLSWQAPNLPFISRQAAKYLGPLTKDIAQKWVEAALDMRKRKIQNQSMVKTGRWSNVLVRKGFFRPELERANPRAQFTSSDKMRVQMIAPLKGQPEQPIPPIENEECCLGGLSDTWKSTAKVPGHALVGQKVSEALDAALESEELAGFEDFLIDSIGTEGVDSSKLEGPIGQLRQVVANTISEPNNPVSTEPVKQNGCSTSIRAKLMKARLELAGDPGVRLAKWIEEGAPAGVVKDMPELDWLFPQVKAEEMGKPEDLEVDYASFANYDGVEDDKAAAEIIQGFIKAGYIHAYDTAEQAEMAVGGKLVISKLGVVKKERTNPTTGVVTIKTRIILDCKQSGVTLSTIRSHKSCLPRVTHAVRGTLGLMDANSNEEEDEIELFVCDISDAFWLIPLHPEERKYFVAKLHGKYFVFQRTAQGPRSAPLTWAAIAAVVARLAQSFFLGRRHRGRLQVYVDDPLFSIRGTRSQRRRAAAKFMIVLAVLGFPIAIAKAKMSKSLVWIGCR